MPAHSERINRPGLTDQQRRALNVRGVSVALSAGAGCGKTFVLTERFLAELEPGRMAARSPLGHLVAITFTERAAREMRNRIRAACRRRLLECPDEHADYWLGLIRELDSARISTIHSFCASLLRGQAVEAGVDPRFRVLDDAQAAALLFELTDATVRDRLAERAGAALDLGARYGLQRLRQMVARLLAQRAEIDWETWCRETPEGLANRWMDFWRNDTVPRVLSSISESAAAREALDLAMRYPPANPKMRARCDYLLEALPRLPQSSRPVDDLIALREAAKVQGAGTKKDWISEEVYVRYREAVKQLRNEIDKVMPQMQFDTAAARDAAELGLHAVALAAEVARRYEARKQELNVLDFNDLLIRARDLLTGKDRASLRRRLAGQIRLLLVDEFQDTDPLQVEMVKALCDNEHLRGKLFVVGDYKQSIYRFRGAQPHVFRRLREEIPPEGQLPLSLNFRSQPAVLEFINALFSDVLGPNYEPLRPHRSQLGPTPAVEFMWAHEGEAEDEGIATFSPANPSVLHPENQDSPQAHGLHPVGLEENDELLSERRRRVEADWIARRIRQLLDSGVPLVWDKSAPADAPTLRPVRSGDIALLFRALTNVEYYEEALQRYGIDYYLVGGRAFYAQQEVFDVLNLLRAVNYPTDEISLAGVLRSPMFGLHDETLFWLAERAGLAAGLFDSEVSENIDSGQRRRVEFAAGTLTELRAIKDRLPVASMLCTALELTGYDAMLLAEFLGERKLANLHKLIDQARDFDRAGIFTLSDFITQLAEFVARQPDEPPAATNPESIDVVKLMSIHQSKGLEFPVVFVPDIGRPRLTRGQPIVFTSQLGPMVKDSENVTGYDLYAMAEREEDLAEHMRLLYVATTRAADRLILSAGVEKPGEVNGPWMELLAERFDLNTGKKKESEESGARGQGSGKVESGEEIEEGAKPQAAEIHHSSLSIHHSFNPSPLDARPSPLAQVVTVAPTVSTKPVDLRLRRDLSKILSKARQMSDEGMGRQPKYVGAIPHDRNARRQYSFSRLSGALVPRPISELLTPADDDLVMPAPLDARGLGTLVHAILAEVNYAEAGDLSALAQCHARQQLLDDLQLIEQAVELVGRFLATERSASIAKASLVHRELEFLLAWNADGVQLHGFIDCLYCDADGNWRLLDYKTNQATAENLVTVALQYELQMLGYATVAERILSRPIAELTLCLLRPGLEYRYDWDDAARQRAVNLIDEALQTYGRLPTGG